MIKVALLTYYNEHPQVIAVEITLDALTNATKSYMLDNQYLIEEDFNDSSTFVDLMRIFNNLDIAISYISLNDCELNPNEAYVSPFTNKTK